MASGNSDGVPIMVHAPRASGDSVPVRLGVVDDDEDVRRALFRLLVASGFVVRAYASAEAFLDAREPADCLVLDVHLGGASGVELYEQLCREGTSPPVVFITAHHELSEGLERLGFPCLWKPFDGTALLAAIETARARRG
jgi:FixJ family two-component response regulator